MSPQECSHFSSLLAMLPALSWLSARGISTHPPTPVDILRRTYRLDLKICFSLPAAGNASGLGQVHQTPELPSRVPKPTFSRSVGQLCWADRSLAAPPFLGHSAEEVPPATAWQPETSVLAGASAAGKSPATVRAEAEQVGEQMGSHGHLAPPLWSWCVSVAAGHLRDRHHPSTNKMGCSGCRELPGQSLDFSAGYFHGIKAVHWTGDRRAKISQEGTILTGYLHPGCIV